MENKRSANKILIVLLLIISVLAILLYRENVRIKNDPQSIAQEEVEDLVQAVGKLYALPMDETPTLATVTDIEKLQDQPFFSSASNGDKILIYAKAKKAILYSPSKDKIIEIAPVNLGEQGEAVNVGEGTDVEEAEDGEE